VVVNVAIGYHDVEIMGNNIRGNGNRCEVKGRARNCIYWYILFIGNVIRNTGRSGYGGICYRYYETRACHIEILKNGIY
jgi:hypothetical protein